MAGEFANGCGFTRTVHTSHHDHGWNVFTHSQCFLQRSEQLRYGLRQQRFDCRWFCGRCLFHALLQVFQQIFGSGDTGICHQERCF